MVGGRGIILDWKGTCFMSFLVMINAAQIWNMNFFIIEKISVSPERLFCFTRGGEELGRVSMKGLSHL